MLYGSVTSNLLRRGQEPFQNIRVLSFHLLGERVDTGPYYVEQQFLYLNVMVA
jgi:hypothetical protein